MSLWFAEGNGAPATAIVNPGYFTSGSIFKEQLIKVRRGGELGIAADEAVIADKISSLTTKKARQSKSKLAEAAEDVKQMTTVTNVQKTAPYYCEWDSAAELRFYEKRSGKLAARPPSRVRTPLGRGYTRYGEVKTVVRSGATKQSAADSEKAEEQAGGIPAAPRPPTARRGIAGRGSNNGRGGTPRGGKAGEEGAVNECKDDGFKVTGVVDTAGRRFSRRRSSSIEGVFDGAGAGQQMGGKSSATLYPLAQVPSLSLPMTETVNTARQRPAIPTLDFPVQEGLVCARRSRCSCDVTKYQNRMYQAGLLGRPPSQLNKRRLSAKQQEHQTQPSDGNVASKRVRSRPQTART